MFRLGCRDRKPDHKPGTTDEYVKAITHHSQQSSAETLYPGEIYDTLKRFLEQKPNTVTKTTNHASSDYAWLASPNLVGQQASSDRQSISDSNSNRGRFEGFADTASCIEALRRNIELSHPQVLFLRGHPSPEWLSSIGAFCYVDPELFRWFLRYRVELGSDYYFNSAPSIMSNIFRFKIFTIGSKNHRSRSSQKEVDVLRGKAADDFQNYQNKLKGNWDLKPGDSIVRNFHMLDERHCVIEQEITISIFDIGKTWMGMISSKTIIDRFADDYSHRLYRCRIQPHPRTAIAMVRERGRNMANYTSPNRSI